jgi:pSer/pThr/pTyr-binding forkhead associated (FHA) protein
MGASGLLSNTYSVIFLLRVALVAILYLVILRVVAVARRDLSQVAIETSAAARAQKSVGVLVVVDNGSTPLIPGSRIAIEPITTIGRSPTNTIVLDSGFVSTEHTRITYRSRSLWVEDMGSRNGTLVDGEPVTEAVAVTPGTILQVGDVRFKFAI